MERKWKAASLLARVEKPLPGPCLWVQSCERAQEQENGRFYRCLGRCWEHSGGSSRPLWEPGLQGGLPSGPTPPLELLGKWYFQHRTWVCLGFFGGTRAGDCSARPVKALGPQVSRETTLITLATALGAHFLGVKAVSLGCQGEAMCGLVRPLCLWLLTPR